MSTGYVDPLLNEFSMRRGLSGGIQEPMQRFDFNFADAGMGGMFGNGMFGGVAPMVLQPLLNTIFGHGGVMPAQFAPMQSLQDQFRSKAYFQARSAAMATAAQADRETYVQMIRGSAQMRGTPWGLDQQRSANVMSGDLAAMSPFMAQAMPEMFDFAHGSRGSATVMAASLHRGGLMGVDPVTGRTGVSGTSAGILANEMHRRFFGVNADLAGWRGLSAGRAGALYEELQTRGMMGTSIGAMSPAEQTAALSNSMTSRQDALRLIQAQDPNRFTALAKAGGAASLTGDAQINKLAESQGLIAGTIENLQKTDQTKFDALLRQFDATKIGNRLKSMSGAVSAMREIFGDLGKPNAPMGDLIEGLNALTQGGMSTMNPAELERTVRTTKVIARTSGLGMQALMGLTSQSATMAQQMGLDPRFGVIAAQGAAEFGAAFGQVGRGDLAAWGRRDADNLRLLDSQLRLNAAASPMATQLGATMRLYETQKAAGVNMTGTPLEAMAQAIMTPGATEFAFGGQMHSLRQREPQWRQFMAMSNINPSIAMGMLRSPTAVQEQIAKYNIVEPVRNTQITEIREMMGRGFHEAVVGQLGDAGLVGDRARNIAQVASAAQAQAMSDMPVETRTNDAARNKFLMDATRAAVLRVPGMTSGEFDRLFPKGQFAVMVSSGVGRIQEQMAKDPRYNYPGGLHAALDANNPQVMRRRAFLQRETAAEVTMGTALSGLGTAGPLARIMNELQNPSNTIGEAIKQGLGGVDPAEIRLRIANIDPALVEKQGGPGTMDRLRLLTEELLTTSREYESTKTEKGLTDDQRLAKREQLAKYMSALRAGSSEAIPLLRETLASANLVAADADPATVRAMAKQVLEGKAGSAEIKERVWGLSLAGGTADAAAVERQQVEILKTAGITSPEGIRLALAGKSTDPKLTQDVRDQLRLHAEAGAGLDVVAAGAGINTKALVGERQLADVVTQQGLLAADMAKDLPKEEGPIRAEMLATRRKHATAAMDRGRRHINTLLGDLPSMKNLGLGGFDLVSGAHKKQQEIARLAAAHNLNPVDLMIGNFDMNTLGTEARAAAKQIIGLQSEVNSATTEMARMAGMKPGVNVPMLPGEIENFEKYKENYTRSDEEQNKRLTSDLMAKMGIDETDRASIETALGKGDDAKARRYALGQSLTARDALQTEAKRRGVSIAQFKKDIDEGPALYKAMAEGKITRADVTKFGSLFATAGRLGEGDETANVLSSIKESDERRTLATTEANNKAGAGLGGLAGMTLKLAGTVKLDAAGNFDFSGASATTMNSTPVPGG